MAEDSSLEGSLKFVLLAHCAYETARMKHRVQSGDPGAVQTLAMDKSFKMRFQLIYNLLEGDAKGEINGQASNGDMKIMLKQLQEAVNTPDKRFQSLTMLILFDGKKYFDVIDMSINDLLLKVKNDVRFLLRWHTFYKIVKSVP